MAEPGLPNKGRRYRKSFFGDITFLQIIRFVFFLFLSLSLVYIYDLHLRGSLQKTILDIWTSYQKVIISLSVFVIYSTVIYQMGVWRGRRR